MQTVAFIVCTSPKKAITYIFLMKYIQTFDKLLGKYLTKYT